MAFAPVFSEKTEQWLAALARFARGGALLVTPAGDIALVRGDVTSDGAHVARTNAPLVISSIGETVSLVCDDGSSVCLLAITEGWVLGVQARGRSDLPDLSNLDDEHRERVKLASERSRRRVLRVLMHRALDDLSLWLAYTHLPHPGGRDSGQSGAPAEVFADRPRKRWN